MRQPIIVPLLILVTLAQLGCATSRAERKSGVAAAPKLALDEVASALETPEGAPIRAFVAALRDQRADEAMGLIDVEAIFARSGVDEVLTPLMSQGLRIGATRRLKLTMEQHGEVLAKGGTAKILRSRPGEASTWFLLRIVPSDWAGATYLELAIREGGTGTSPIIEFYEYGNPGPVSESLRNGARMLVGDAQATSAKPIPASMRLWAESGVPLTAFAQAIMKKDNAAALSAFDALPRAIREDKFMIAQKVALAQTQEEEVYLAALDELLRLHPNEPNSQLLLLDALAMRKEHERMLTTLETIERDIVADPFMTTLRAYALVELGRDDEAIAALESAIHRESDFLMPWLFLLGAHAKAGDDQKAMEVLERSKAAGVDWSPMCGQEGFEMFCDG